MLVVWSSTIAVTVAAAGAQGTKNVNHCWSFIHGLLLNLWIARPVNARATKSLGNIWIASPGLAIACPMAKKGAAYQPVKVNPMRHQVPRPTREGEGGDPGLNEGRYGRAKETPRSRTRFPETMKCTPRVAGPVGFEPTTFGSPC